MKDLDSDVDDKQMTHSDEPTIKADLEAMLAFADSVLGYQESDKRRVGSPVDGALNTDLARRGANYILRLIKDVKRLEVGLKAEGSCIICWTASWEPVENEEDCTIAEHPHPEEGCLRCGHCAVLTSYKALESGLEDAEADVKRLEAERNKFRDLTKRAAVGSLPLAGVDEAELIDKLETENKRLRELTKRYNEWRKR